MNNTKIDERRSLTEQFELQREEEHMFEALRDYANELEKQNLELTWLCRLKQERLQQMYQNLCFISELGRWSIGKKAYGHMAQLILQQSRQKLSLMNMSFSDAAYNFFPDEHLGGISSASASRQEVIGSGYNSGRGIQREDRRALLWK